MNFFIPEASDEAQAERVYAGIIKHVENQTGDTIKPRRISSMGFTHNGVKYTATVGEPFPRLEEPVIALLEGNLFYLCTPNRAVIRGEPYLIGRDEVNWVKEFGTETLTAEG
jgi:hypothetical protein